MSKILWNVRESGELTAELWQSFKIRATAAGHSPTAALTRIIRRYLDRGFDDGAPERREDSDE